ncbi:SUMF1/EgtB/PvdO family nonheme iron enzyme [Sphaerochaeta sp.]|uniref:SUMF1/EgtB/PvdO family nonheme iron enzyme n=1 Tax=Sphaerochaeta sp. TaxID=1972642 RepID=UPI0025893BA6|nr:SUMF1/EgtB/PvdO family nonheme iron enzyme [Sphaerochaeta sp.]
MDDPLSVGFSGMPDSVEAGDTVTLTSTGLYSGNVQYRWYVNGVRQTDQTASSFSHTFGAAGTHMVSLLVLDGGSLGGYGESVTVSEAGQAGEYSIPMAYVEGGTFQIGSNDYPNEQPIHSVTVDSFYMGTYEITQDIYEEVMGTNPSFFRGSRLPVEMVSWYDAAAFANALSRRDGLDEVYTIKGNTVTCDWTKRGYRLPTEAEWEFAARGGLQSQGYLYAGSNTVGDVAWFRDNSSSRTHDSGTKAANELGLHDMSGNVWEWCWDWYGDVYPSDLPQTNPTGLSTGTSRILRGGCWGGDSAMALRLSARYLYTPSDLYKHIGFRLILPVEGWEYEIGALGPSGGYVFYDDEIGYDKNYNGKIEVSEKNVLLDGKRYLEAAPSDILTDSTDFYHSFGYLRTTPEGSNEVIGGTNTAVGAGAANTTAMVKKMGSAAYTRETGSTKTSNYATRLCDIYEAGGYEDWFLPSRDELDIMYRNLKVQNLGGLSILGYWSSSEINAESAWSQYFKNGTMSSIYRLNEYGVRPVRAF